MPTDRTCATCNHAEPEDECCNMGQPYGTPCCGWRPTVVSHDRLAAEVARLQALVATLTEGRQRADRECVELRAKLADAVEDACTTECRDDVEHLECTIDTLTKERAMLRDELRDRTRERDECGDEVERRDEMIEDLRAEVERLKGDGEHTPEHPGSPRYAVSIVWSDEDEAYVATVPEFPGVSATGDTPEEAVKEVAVALQLTMATMKESREPLPQPMKRSPRSGNVHLRIPRGLHAELARLAELEDVSLNHFLVAALAGVTTVGVIEHRIGERCRAPACHGTGKKVAR